MISWISFLSTLMHQRIHEDAENKKKHAQHAIIYEVYYTSYELDMVGAVRERGECTPIRDPVRSVQG